MRAMR
ncbi:hypothetical protein VTH82DRAFT_2481 [Thermothelomyces myriococcoides]